MWFDYVSDSYGLVLMDFLHNTCSINVAIERSKVLVKVSKCIHGFSVKNPAIVILIDDFVSLLSVKKYTVCIEYPDPPGRSER